VAAFLTLASAEARSVNAPAATNARTCGENPIPSASTSPGKVEIPTAWEKKASALSTIQGPISPAATASRRISTAARWTYGRVKGSINASVISCLSLASDRPGPERNETQYQKRYTMRSSLKSDGPVIADPVARLAR